MLDLTGLVDRYAAWLPLIIFFCRIADVSIGTIRTIFVVRGARIIAPVLGFFEVTIWILAVSSVVKRLDQPLNILGYAGGFATGNWVGMWLESKMAIGQQIVRLISRERGHSIAHTLRLAGWGVTEVYGRGRDGPVIMCFVAVARKDTPAVVRLGKQVDPDVFTTVEDTRDTDLTLYREVAQEKTDWRAVVKRK